MVDSGWRDGRRLASTRFRTEQHEVNIDGRRHIYYVEGSGPPVVLIHGLSGSSRWWWRNIPELAEEFTVYLLDLPGFGSMRDERRGFELSEAAAWLASWMNELELEPAHVVAHSLGGYIGVRLAVQYSELVDRLVLVAPAGISEDKPLVGYSISLLRAAGQLRPRFATIFARDFIRAGPRTILRSARELLSEDATAELHKISQPTLLIWGARDSMIPPTIGRVFREEIPNSRLLVFERVGHVPMIDSHREFNDAVMRFLHGEQVGE
jgi:pimeloyl-ACP methyl ester carboxylesterase